MPLLVSLTSHTRNDLANDRLHPRSPYDCRTTREACLGRHRCARGNRVPGYTTEDAQRQDHAPVAESPGIGPGCERYFDIGRIEGPPQLSVSDKHTFSNCREF